MQRENFGLLSFAHGNEIKLHVLKWMGQSFVSLAKSYPFQNRCCPHYSGNYKRWTCPFEYNVFNAGLMHGCMHGQIYREIEVLSWHFFVIFAVCFRSLSCWTVNWHPNTDLLRVETGPVQGFACIWHHPSCLWWQQASQLIQLKSNPKARVISCD